MADNYTTVRTIGPPPGPYRLTWSLIMAYCVPSSGNLEIIHTTQVNSSVHFSIGDDEENVSPFNLTAGCLYTQAKFLSRVQR